ncbi:pt repeat family protein [Colletotrichum plurivorum]|uniref:Pt repeat family protein n=1 Tax=Colletotrichum plurivorum TaxID=2175906 RepID=A0A8H6NRA8_9PEZI|nr:pt repeat family protein [Colletotrichum plurivorum]
MADLDLVRPSTSYSGVSGTQRRFLLSSPGRPRTATGHSEPKFTPTPPAGLAVRVCIKFQPSLDLTYERQYHTSYGFEPSDQICHALVRRLTHCSLELLTRRDSSALEPSIPQIGDGKPLRFELTYQIYRGGPEPWAIKSFRSYQKYPMDKSSAMEVARSTDRIVGSFLKCHDKSFRWVHGKIRERSGSDLEILKPLSNPVSLLHIPQARFIDATQDWEFVPGYEITLHFRSRCKSRRPREWERTITLKSTQNSPLTLSHGEDMAWVLSTAMQRSLDARKMAFDRQHRSCNQFDLEECHHSEQNAVHVSFQISNQLGLDHRHLRRELDSNLLLFQDPDSLDCERFVSQLEHSFAAVRDDTDKELSEMDDLRLTVYELSGRGWKAEKPFAVCLDSTACYSRRTIKAMLDRVQTGIADILGGNDISITLMVHKRGHLVLDKTLVARSPYYATGQRQGEDSEAVKQTFLTKLKDRMRSDIAMVVKDTCSLYDAEPKNIRVVERPVPAANDPAEMEVLPSSSPLPIPTPCGPVPESFDGSSKKPSEPLAQQGETLQSRGPDGVITPVGLSQRPETPTKATASKDQFDGQSSFSISLTEDGETTFTASSSAPSLVDGDIGTPRDSLLVTPTFMRTLSGHPQPFDANPNIAGSDTSDSELIEDSLAGPSTPTMQRFNGPRQFSLFGKGSHSVSRLSLVSTTDSEKQSLAESEPAPEVEDVVQIQEPKSEESSLAESAFEPAQAPPSPEVQPEAAVQEPVFEGWLEYCCVPVDEEEPPAAPESVSAPAVEESVAEQESREGIEATRTEPVIVITPDEEDASPQSYVFEGFLEYTIETIVEEDEEEDEFHDAGSTAAMDVASSPSSFATAAETSINSPISLDFAVSAMDMDHMATSPPDLLSAIEKIAPLPPTDEANETAPAVQDPAAKSVPTSEVVACTSTTDTIEPTPIPPPAPETAEPCSVPEVENESSPAPVTEPSEPRLDPSAEIHRDPSLLVLNEAARSVSSVEAPRTPTSDSAASISDRDEAHESGTPPLMTETEDSDYSESAEPAEPAEPSVPFPDLPVETVHHDESRSLSLWTPSRLSFPLDDWSESYFAHDRKPSIPRPLFARPSSSASFSHPFSHKRQFSSPTAGLFGFQEPRRLDVGLRGALFGLAALRHGAGGSKLERSTSQVLLKLENDRGTVIVPSGHSNPGSRRNSDARGIGGAGVLGLGNAFAF